MKTLTSSPLRNQPWPWPKVDVNNFSDLALQNKIIIPKIGVYDLGKDPNWAVPAGAASNTIELYLNSLQSVHLLLHRFLASADERYITHASYIFRNYFSAIDGLDDLHKIAWRDEHAVANRLFVLVSLLHASASAIDMAGISETKLIELIVVHAKWLMIDHHYVKNNHGVMMDMALLNAAVLTSSILPKESSLWIEKAVKRVGEMLSFSFDEDGCCTENSPAYHYVNYALFNNIYQFLTDHNIQFPDEDLWKSRLKRIVSVGHILVRQNKSLPLIGDTEGHIGAFFPFVEGDLSDGIGYYPKSGFFVYKVGEIYFTLRGGGSSFSHRHVDDTSITLFYKGEDFIVDPGMYNYDSSDKLRRWFTSPNAHSGFYLESAGMARYSKFSGPESVGGLKDLTINDNGFDIGAWHDLCPESRVYRAISFDGKSILLSDSFYSGFDCKWTQSFHLHPNATIELAIDRRSATISSCNAKIMITIISEGSYIELVTGHYSSTFMAKQDAATIAIRGCSPCISLHTRVDLL